MNLLFSSNVNHIQNRMVNLSFLCVLINFVIISDSKTLSPAQEPILTADESSAEFFKDRVCTTEECVKSATYLRSSMNTSVDPCDDFYQFTCGNWGFEHPIQKGYTYSSSVTVVKQKLLNDVLTFLKSNESQDEPTPLLKSRDLFRSCMDQEARDNLGYDIVFKYLSLLGLPAVPRFFNLTDTDEDINDYKFDWMKTDIAMNAIFRVQLFINSEVIMSNSTQSIITCKIPKYKFNFQSLELTLQEAEKLMNAEIFTENKSDITEAWLEMTNFSFTTLIKEKYDLPEDFHERFEAAMKVISNIETYISSIKKQLKKLERGFGYDTYVTIGDFQNVINKFLTKNKLKPKLFWKQYLEESFRLSNLTLNLNDEEQIFVHFKDTFYFKAIAVLISKKQDVDLELWAWWRAVLNIIIHTTSDALQYTEKILNVTGINTERPRELVCTILTHYRMDFATTYSITDKSFINKTKPELKEIWNNIVEAFEMRVNSLTWMDDVTKNHTIEKSRAMSSFIGYPEWLLNKTLLEIYYSNLTINADTFLDNIVDINKFNTKRVLQQLFLDNSNKWPVTVNLMMLNAFYSAIRNIIVIPFSTVDYLFYNRGMEALNYGSIGTVLGHELTHGFDNRGRHYDKYGTIGTWWSSRTSLDFSNMTECFVEQYDNFYVPETDSFIDGSLTLGENLADNGGLLHAYLAYQNHKKNNGEQKLPGLEKFTSDQLFFLSYANFWCSEERPGFNKSLKDVHCPNKYRVLGPLINSEEFSTAFNCPVGSKMNPVKSKCKIW